MTTPTPPQSDAPPVGEGLTDGCCMVPIQPTDKMLRAGYSAFIDSPSMSFAGRIPDIWAAMNAACPAPAVIALPWVGKDGQLHVATGYAAARPVPAPSAAPAEPAGGGELDLLEEIETAIAVMRKGPVRRNSKRGVIVDIDATEAVMVRAADLMEGVTKALASQVAERHRNDDRPRR